MLNWHKLGIGIVLFFGSALFLSFVSSVLLHRMAKKTKAKALSSRDYFWALNGPVFVALILCGFSLFSVCCDEGAGTSIKPVMMTKAFLLIELFLGGILAWAFAKTIRYIIETERWSRAVKLRRLNPSPKLKATLAILKQNIGANFPCYEVESMQIPSATLGWFHSWAVFSSSLARRLSQDEMEGILWHEYHHAKSLDNLKKLVSFFSLQVCGRIPWCRYLFHQWEEAAEFCSDQFAVGKTNHPLDVASALAATAEETAKQIKLSFVSAFAHEQTGVIRRVEAILWQWENKTPYVSSTKFLFYGMAGGCLWLMGMRKLELVPSFWCFIMHHVGR